MAIMASAADHEKKAEEDRVIFSEDDSMMSGIGGGSSSEMAPLHIEDAIARAVAERSKAGKPLMCGNTRVFPIAMVLLTTLTSILVSWLG